MANPPSGVERIYAGKIGIPIGPLAVTQGTIYHIVWTNEHSNVTDNWYSVNNMHNHSMPLPYHPYGPWQSIATLTTSNNGTTFSPRNRWIPHFLLRYADGVIVGQPLTDAASTSNIMTLDGGGTKEGCAREIGGSWQIRQRWTHDADAMAATRWRGRVWRRNSSTTDPLRVRLEREETGGSVTTLADVNIPANSIFQTNWDNQEGQVFPCVDVPLGASVILEQGRTYRLRLSSGSSTRYAMRAPNGGPRSLLNIGWGAWLGRAEYSINGGSSWTGMHHYDQDDRDTNDWNMALHNVDG